ncbi:MAG: T9SS type A sorting domain-containing protein, partial [Bacteroidales bacterium]|nr:T9SS type A sorting domain-containing protein [Bacteroidales bacterium]
TSSISLTWNAVENALSYNIYNGVNKVANVTTTSYVVDNLNYYTDYCFTVSAVRNETETDKSEEACSKTFDLSITTPENLIAEALSFSSISLTWNAVENALSYNVYNGGIMIANVTGNSYIVNDLNYDTDYCYTVSAVRNETETEKSESACAKTLLPITTPENVIAEATSVSSISLTWNAVENALSYNVYSGENKIANVIENTYIVNELNYYTDYCFTVTAVRNETETEKSESACAKTFDLPIVAPTNFAATPINTASIILTWNIVENALSYNVYQGNSLIANVASNMYSANDLESYTEYCFAVTAVRNETESDKSEEVCAKTMDLSVTKPEEVAATPTSTSSIIITWDIVENALSYNLYRDNELVKNLKNTNYTDTGLEYDTEYCYVVTAVRNETESDKSEQVCVKTLGEGVNETSLYVNVYPTPATDKLYIDTEAYIEEICIYTLSGVMIYREIDFDNKSIDVSNMNSGVYFVMIKTNDVVVTKRFVKE